MGVGTSFRELRSAVAFAVSRLARNVVLGIFVVRASLSQMLRRISMASIYQYATTWERVADDLGDGHFAPDSPDGGGWELVSTAASGDKIFYSWRRDWEDSYYEEGS